MCWFLWSKGLSEWKLNFAFCCGCAKWWCALINVWCQILGLCLRGNINSFGPQTPITWSHNTVACSSPSSSKIGSLDRSIFHNPNILTWVVNTCWGHICFLSLYLCTWAKKHIFMKAMVQHPQHVLFSSFQRRSLSLHTVSRFSKLSSLHVI